MSPTRFHAVLLIAALTAACGEDDRPQAGDVQGTWTLAEDSAGAVVLDIQGSEIDVFTENAIGDCFARVGYTIIERRGIDFRITNGADTITIELQRDGDVLRVAAFDQEAEYVLTSFDPTTLTICQPPEPDAECALLPELQVGVEVVDSLDETDARTYLGTRYQLYAIDAGPVDVTVSMASEDVDSYLSLHDSTGTFIVANDDRSSRTLDAELRATLEPGCHIVMATTASADELGEFEIVLRLPAPGAAPRRTK